MRINIFSAHNPYNPYITLPILQLHCSSAFMPQPIIPQFYNVYSLVEKLRYRTMYLETLPSYSTATPNPTPAMSECACPHGLCLGDLRVAG